MIEFRSRWHLVSFFGFFCFGGTHGLVCLKEKSQVELKGQKKKKTANNFVRDLFPVGWSWSNYSSSGARQQVVSRPWNDGERLAYFSFDVDVKGEGANAKMRKWLVEGQLNQSTESPSSSTLLELNRRTVLYHLDGDFSAVFFDFLLGLRLGPSDLVGSCLFFVSELDSARLASK